MMREFIKKKFLSKTYFGHPSGLYVLFFTEMWERFSYYGMRSLLILYMTYYLLNDPARAAEIMGYNDLRAFLVRIFGEMSVQQMGSQIYGLYTGFVYFTPFFGGMIADKLLGKHRSVFLGATLMAIGHFLMASEELFLLALLFIIFGYGFFKPSLSTQVGNLYKEGDPKIDSAFSIYYMGVNLGALLSPFVCGTLGQKVGWHWGFGAAGVGMIFCLIFYGIGSVLIPKKEIVKQTGTEKKSEPLTPTEWNAVIALAILCFLNIVFWAIYEQQGNTLQLWADKKINWHIFPSSWFQAFNPLFILLVTPLLLEFWAWQAKRKGEPSTITKMGIGCLFCGSAYLLMILAALLLPGEQKGSLFWLMGTSLIFTLGELYLSPIGLSLVVQVAPKRIVASMMGLWYMSSFFGNYMTGYLGTFYEIMPKESFFFMLFALGVGTGLAFFLVRRPIDKAIGKSV